jgi:cyclic pyranopterin monophosphate synthase
MFTHLDDKNQARMVDVSSKTPSQRTALAEARVILPEEVLCHFDGHDIVSKKGSVFQTAIIAGIMASKKTHELIPMCHPVGLENCHITIELNEQKEVVIQGLTTVTHKTGVEMEALTAVSVAALTIYDMCKGLSQNIRIEGVRLLRKTGGKSDFVCEKASKADHIQV